MLKKLAFLPGVVKTNTDYASPGRYVDAQWVHFIGGFPEKMRGWAATIADLLTGICRAIRPWRDNSEVDRCGFGTHSKLYVLTQGVLENVTPLRARLFGNLSDALTTTNGSNVAQVHHPGHQQAVGDRVSLVAAEDVGGLTVQGNFIVDTVPGVDDYTIHTTAEATASETGGGAIAFLYNRKALDPNPITTVSGSPLVTVADADNLSVAGDTVIIEGATAVGGITLNGSYLISTADSLGYVVTAGSNATSSATGGGSAVTAQSEISLETINNFSTGGYGAGLYGSGLYGMSTPAAQITGLRTWTLAAYGEWLLANPRGGTLYVWDPTIGGRALPLFGAPEQLLSFFVTSERYIVALGKDGDHLKIGWPDQIDPTDWVPRAPSLGDPGNTANSSRRVQGGNYLLSGGEVRNQTSLIFSDTAVFLHQWRPDDFVFTTVKLADNAGLFGPNAFAILGETAYWVSDGQFRLWNGSIDLLPSDDVREFFFDNVDRDQRAKVVMGTIAANNELIILYQTTGQTEINRYLIYNTVDRIWTVGTISRTAWCDRGLFPYPIATEADGHIWNHEFGRDGNGAAIDSYITAAPLDIDDGNSSLDIMGFIPDIKDQAGPLSLSVLTRQRPEDAPTVEGPFVIDPTGHMPDLRLDGAMAGYKIESNVVGGHFGIGVCRVDVQPGGARRP